MTDNIKKESSSSGGSTDAGIKGFQAAGSPLVKRKMLNASKPFEEEVNLDELFEEAVIEALLNGETIEESVKKRGSQWTIIDDQTGSQLGSYAKRSVAWEKQRQIKKAKKAQNKAKRKSQKARNKVEKDKPAEIKDKAKKSKGAKKSKKVQKAKKVKISKESLTHALSVLLEGSAISYVFDQSPVSEDSLGWDSFVSKLSRETVFSDNKLKAILRNMAKAEAKLLGLAINAIKSALESGGQFSVIQGQASQDECGDVFINFIVHLKEDNKKIKLGVKIENAKPLLVFPEEAREILNSLGTEGGKLLRAEIMHCQETVLDNMDDVVKIVHKRNEYLRNLENKIDNIVSNMGPLQVALIKNILKSKYKGVR